MCRAGLGGGVGGLPYFTTLLAEIVLMESSTLAVTNNAFSYGTRGTAHRDASHGNVNNLLV